MDTTLTPIRLRLREVRQAAGLSQEELAERIGVRQATISNLETGTTGTERIDVDILDRLCEALKVEPGELLERVRGPKR